MGTGLYRVHSEAIKTGFKHHGTGAFPRAEAQQYADELNKDSQNKPFLRFWIEPVSEEEQA